MTRTLAILLAGSLAGCASAPPSEGSADPARTAAATLAQHHWRLTDARDGSGQRIDALLARADRPLQLDFHRRELSVANTCNRMRAVYSIAGDELELGPLASTLMACADPKLAALDAAVGRVLRGTLGFALDRSGAEPVLTLTTAQGDTLELTGAPTAETRYGQPGTTVFLEVAPATRPCNDPGRPDAQCLQVRLLHYDRDGIRTGEPGPWEVLGQAIEGYTHEPGIRNVLRVKRYELADPPADASSVAYVLDLVVESEVVPRD